MKYLLWIPALFVIASIGCKKTENKSVAVLKTTAATGITSTSAITGGTITSNGGSTITKSGVCWATHINPSLSDSITTDGSTTGTFSSALNALNANTTYYVRAYAINATGTGYGNLDSFITQKGLATVSTSAVTNIVPLTARSGGTITNDGGSPITARGIVWSTSPHPTLANFKTTDSVGTGTFTDSLTNLASQTLYYVRAYATNNTGTAYGNELSFSAATANTITDIDGNVYPYVQLGTQAWMAANLRTTHYQNGDPITNGLTNFAWKTSTVGAYTYPNGDSNNNAKLGKLYNSFAVADSRNACPMGWHVPTDAEWQTLEFYEGMTPADTGTYNTGGRGTVGAKFLVGGSSGLNLTNAGIFFSGNGNYYYFNTQGWYYSSTIANPAFGAYYYRAFNTVSGNSGPIARNSASYIMSVRCIKN